MRRKKEVLGGEEDVEGSESVEEVLEMKGREVERRRRVDDMVVVVVVVVVSG